MSRRHELCNGPDVRAVAAIPAIGLLAGCSIGFIAPDEVAPFATVWLLAAGVASVLAWRTERAVVLAAAAATVFAAGGSMLSARAWEEAWRPSLRLAFEELARAERAHAAASHRVLPEDDEAFAIVTGVLRSDASPSPSGVSLRIEAEGIRGREGREGQDGQERRVSGGLLVTVVGSLGPAHIDEWRAGRRITMPVQLHRPSRYLDPGVPDGERILARSGITLVGTVKSGALVDVEGNGPWWTELAGHLRLETRKVIGRFVGRWGPDSAAIVTAILIGDRTGLDDDVQRSLQEAGTYHVIAISGGNIAILAGLLLGAFRLAGCLGRSAMLAAIVVLVAYAGLVNGGASVSRATLTAVIYFAARALDHRSAPLNTLWIASAVLLVADPLVVADPGFVLTFGATLGILLFPQTTQSSQSTQNTGSVKSKLLSAFSAASALYVVVAGLFRASLAAEALLFPVGAAVFGRVTFAGLALNLLAIPMMAVAQIAGMAVVAAAGLSDHLALIAGWSAHVGAAGLIWSAALVRFAPMVTYRVAAPSWGALVIYYTALFTWWTLWRRRMVSGSAEARPVVPFRRVAFGVTIGAAVWILVEPSLLLAGRGDGRLHVTFLDVGQGDSALLRFPHGATMLVDGGGLAGSTTFDIGDRVVAPVLREAGIRRLGYLVLTHGDADHVGGAAAVIDEFSPREVWEGIPVPPFEPLASLRRQAQAAGARWANVYRGSHISVDGVEIRALHPQPADWERQKVRNDDSIVLEVRWRDVSVVLTGDVGREVEREVSRTIGAAAIRVLKVPHHGSLTSSSVEFLQAVRPDVAIASAGRANHFGHPAAAVLQRYRDIGAEIFRTDQDGAVTLETDGYALDIRTFTGRRFMMPPATASSRNHEDTKVTKK